MGDPLRVLVVVADPSHGAADRVRLTDLLEPLARHGVEVRAWLDPHLLVTSRGAADLAAAVAAGEADVSGLDALVWADVIWVRRFAAQPPPDPDQPSNREALPPGLLDLLTAAGINRGILRGRGLLYDLDADLLEPRDRTLAAGAQGHRAQVELALELSDVVTVATPLLRDAARRRAPRAEPLVIPTAIDLADYQPVGRQPGRVPVIAAIDTLDGPGGIEAWLPELARARRSGLAFTLVRLCDPRAKALSGFDEVVEVREEAADWRDKLAAIAPDIVLAPMAGDRFGRSAHDLTWLEATAVGAATIADGRAGGAYSHLCDGSDARLIAAPQALVPALRELLTSPDVRDSLVAGARARIEHDRTIEAAAALWGDAFRQAMERASSRGEGAAELRRRGARRAAIAAAAGESELQEAAPAANEKDVPSGVDDRPRTEELFSLVGVLGSDFDIRPAVEAALAVETACMEIVLAGTREACDLACRALPAAASRVRFVAVAAPDAPARDLLAAAVAAAAGEWIAFLDPRSELHPGALEQLRSLALENSLDGIFGEIAVVRGNGGVDRLGGWPPDATTFRRDALLVARRVTRLGLSPAHAELSDPILDWLLGLMEAGCAVGSAGVVVARELPAAARTSKVRSTGRGVPYADGGETRLLGIVAGAGDRSSRSDELAGHISDWTSRYHLSRLRGNLLDSIAFPAAARVLDVGAGTGTIARHLGERGLDVVALEGSIDRARVASVRCLDLPNVEIVHGTVGDFEDAQGFDAVCVVGVLEYSGAFQGGAAGPQAFLARLREAVRPNGALVLAIENRFGLKYLQGYAEDHLARPWVGIDGYGGSGGIRTWSRRRLGRLLAEAGFPAQRWRYPFPDYKLPTLVLDERAYREPDAATLVDALVREPVKDYAHPRPGGRDDRGAHQGFLEAGLGEEVANSFLVIAAADDDALSTFAPGHGPLAWLYGDERLSPWLRRRLLMPAEGKRALLDVGGARVTERRGLRQVRSERESFVTGPTLEQELKSALQDGGLPKAAPTIAAWVAAIDAEASVARAERTPSPERHAAVSHPLAPRSRKPGLPGSMVDLIPANFIRVSPAEIVRVDKEWQVDGEVDRDLAIYRGCWYTALSALLSNWGGAWAPSVTPREAADDLARTAGLVPDDALFAHLCEAEAWLQSRVQGADPQRMIAGMVALASTRRSPGQLTISG